jgi:hypothetical protein
VGVFMASVDVGNPCTQSWLVRTGQRWKLLVGLGLIGVSGAQFVLMILEVQTPSVEFSAGIALIGGQIVSGVAGLVLIAFTIRCDHCGRRIGWYVMSRRSASSWIADLWRVQACPLCRHSGHAE